MKTWSRMRTLAAGAALVIGLTAAGTDLVGAAPQANDSTQMTLYSVTCPSWGDIPANQSPSEWDETGHGGSLDTSADTTLADVNDIPAGCSAAKDFAFSVHGRERRNLTVSGDESFALSESEQSTAASDGLWVSVQPPVGVAFAGLRCFDDVQFGDRLEHVVIAPGTEQVTCIAFGVAGAAKQNLTLLAVTCESWSQVPANDEPTEWDETGHGKEMQGGIGNALADPSDIPASCDKGENFVFTLSRGADGTELTSEKVSSRNGKTITLEGKAFEALSDGGLMVRVAPRDGYAFAGLRCYDDVIFGDNLEQIYVPKSTLPVPSLYCIGFGVKEPK